MIESKPCRMCAMHTLAHRWMCVCAILERFKNKFNGAICALHVSQSFVKKRKMNNKQQSKKKNEIKMCKKNLSERAYEVSEFRVQQ